MKKSILFAFTMLAFSSGLIAQTDSSRQTVATLLLGPIYAANLHHYGRTDSLKSSALLPTLYLQFDSAGWYISATSVYITNKTEPLTYAGTITEGGYKFGQKLNGFGGNVYANKFFYNSAQLPQSALQEQVGSNFYYLDKAINLSGSASLAFSDKTDGFVSLGANHIFKYVKGKNVFLATPTFVANAGTQNFTTSTNQPGTIPGITPSQQELANSSRFTLLDYELTMPLVYARNHLFIIITPSYIVPENVYTVAGHPELSETASDLFYVNLTVLYSFKFYKN
jgi:hypothetical protein